MATQRWRLDVAYDGGSFHGVAPQPRDRTVVGELTTCLQRTLRYDGPLFVVVAGRTDTKVHALGQVIHFDLPVDVLSDGRLESVRRSVNHQLHGEIVIRRIQRVDATFDARRSAQWRAYRYLVAEGDDPALAAAGAVAWTVRGPLDVAAMDAVAATLVGEHDFRSFCRRPPDKRPDTPLRRQVHAAGWRAVDDGPLGVLGAGPLYRFDVRAASFCHQMVRSLVATMVAVGQGRFDPAEVALRLESPQRTGLPAPAPPSGLCLLAVGYPELAGGPSGSVS